MSSDHNRRMATPKTAKHGKSAIPSQTETSLQFCDAKRSDACLRGFSSLYDQQILCDVTLEAQGQSFPCHKAMLAASSPYFQVRSAKVLDFIPQTNTMLCFLCAQAMFSGHFSEQHTSRIQLKEVSSSSLRLILKYLYTGEFSVTLSTPSCGFSIHGG